jgi:hypothetical protein
MAAALTECALELHGHRGLLALLSRRDFGDSLAAACGLDNESRSHLPALLARGLERDAGRLSLEICERSHTARVPSLGETPLFAVAPEDSLARRRRAPLDTERRLAAALRLGRSVRPWTSEPLGAPADERRARELFALALLAGLVADDSEPALLRFALGSLDGAPYGVPLAVYDGVLATLESLLFRADDDAPRAHPLAVWHAELRHLEENVVALSPDRLADKERARAVELDARDRSSAATDAPRLARRPQRHVRRTPDFVPEAAPAFVVRAQPDLFAP